MDTPKRRKYPAMAAMLLVVAAATVYQVFGAESAEATAAELVARGLATVRQAVLERTLQGGWTVTHLNGSP